MDLLAAVDAAGDRPAILSETASLTYGDLLERVRRVAAGLELRGVSYGDRRPVAVVADSDLESLIRIHALLWLRVPVTLLHSRWTETERARAIEDTGSHVVEFAEAASRTMIARSSNLDREHLAALVFTSGTSGRPKAVQLSHRAFLASAAAHREHLGVHEQERWLLDLPLAHVGGLSILTRALTFARTVILGGIRMAASHHATIGSAVPTQLARMSDHELSALAALRGVLVGGAPLSPTLESRLRAQRIRALPTYGMTETCSQIATAGDYTSGGSVGRPLAGVQVRIEEGEILVRGETMMSGYVGGPPHLPSDWHRTGDLGAIDASGELRILGRRDRRIVTGGENVDPFEVECAIRSVRGVRDVFVFALPDPIWGDRIAALVEGEGFAREAILELTSSELASFKRPRELAFIPSLPRNGMGKVDVPRATQAFATARMRLLPRSHLR